MKIITMRAAACDLRAGDRVLLEGRRRPVTILTVGTDEAFEAESKKGEQSCSV